MPRKIEKKERGVFEKDPGSDIWWIRHYIDGRERREKVGRRGDAIKLYKVPESDALRGVKLPTMKHKGIRFHVIAQEAISWYIEHGRKDLKGFRIRMNILLKDLEIVSQTKSNHPISMHGSVHTTARRRRRIATRTGSARRSRLPWRMAKLLRTRRASLNNALRRTDAFASCQMTKRKLSVLSLPNDALFT
jgi:hypothetical protein